MKRLAWIASGLLLLAVQVIGWCGCAATAKAQAGRDVQQQTGAVNLGELLSSMEARLQASMKDASQTAGRDINQNFDREVLLLLVQGMIGLVGLQTLIQAWHAWLKFRQVQKGVPDGHSRAVSGGD